MHRVGHSVRRVGHSVRRVGHSVRRVGHSVCRWTARLLWSVTICTRCHQVRMCMHVAHVYQIELLVVFILVFLC